MVGTLTSTAWLRVVLFSDFFEAWTFLGDGDGQRVADEARAAILEQRTGRGHVEDGAIARRDVVARLGAHAHRLMDRRGRRGGDATGQQRQQRYQDDRVFHDLIHPWLANQMLLSFDSIWSQVVTALEFIS
jgi:hypothetical protein